MKPVMHYLAERFPMRRYLPLTCILYLAHGLTVDFYSLRPLNFILLILLLLTFRLMDDLFDLRSDRKEFPERTLAKINNPGLFITLLNVLFLVPVTVFLLIHEFLSLYVLLATILLLCTWYAKIRYIFTSRLLHSMIVLLKYPLFLYILKPGLSRPEIPALIYLTFLMFEIRDDPQLQSNITAERIRYLGLIAYLGILILLLDLPSQSWAGWTVLFISFGLQLLVITMKRPPVVYVPFINTFLLFIFLSARYFL